MRRSNNNKSYALSTFTQNPGWPIQRIARFNICRMVSDRTADLLDGSYACIIYLITSIYPVRHVAIQLAIDHTHTHSSESSTFHFRSLSLSSFFLIAIFCSVRSCFCVQSYWISKNGRSEISHCISRRDRIHHHPNSSRQHSVLPPWVWRQRVIELAIGWYCDSRDMLL